MNARTTVKSAIAEAAAKVAAGNSDLADRAMVSWGGKAVRAQINKEKIAEKVIDLLRDLPPATDQVEGPSEDFMNLFSSLSENASSENLQHLFASVLAGEIRKPKSFSLRTIQFITVMDNQLAEAVIQFRPWITDDFIINTDRFKQGEALNLLGLLMDVGIVRTPPGVGLSRILSSDHGTEALWLFKRRCIAFKCSPGKVFVPGMVLTPMGVEVMSLLTAEDDADFMNEAAHTLKKITGVQNVRIGDFILVDGAPRPENLKPVS